jgi:quercetin dioxygenase-like cupin family protein
LNNPLASLAVPPFSVLTPRPLALPRRLSELTETRPIFVASPSQGSRIAAAAVHFTPGARTAWHTHPHGQTIWVTEGVGLCQLEGGPVETIRPGDRVFFAPGENHWHGATATRLMTHVAMQQADDDGNVVTWGEHVSDAEYGARWTSS